MPVLRTITHLILAAALVVGLADAAARADDGKVVYKSESSFEDTAFALESAIVDRGLVIDYQSFIGNMLARTGADVGSDKAIFGDAQIFVFCSAVLSRKMMEADPANVALCPWGVFVYDLPGEPEASYVGYRTLVDAQTPQEDARREIQALLDDIVREAGDVE
ncbi:MAG: DUF302 domain-containing protein [Pseudomonadota bacterium]